MPKHVNLLYVSTLSQKVLMDLEIKGQLSDGHWENSRPMDHWESWCDAEVVVGPAGMIGRNFYPRREKYALRSPELLEVVSGRMIGYVRIALKLGYEAAHALRWCVKCDCTLDVPSDDLRGEYWDEERALIAQYGVDNLRTILADESTYTYKNLLVDLKALQAAMRTSMLDREHAYGAQLVKAVDDATLERLEVERAKKREAIKAAVVADAEAYIKAMENGGQH